MKTNPLTAILLVVLAASSIGSVALCMKFTNARRELGRLQGQVAQIAAQQQLIQALWNEARSYSQTHADLRPVLEQISNTPMGVAAGQPAGAPAGAPQSSK